jgi:hypothetical protein
LNRCSVARATFGRKIIPLRLAAASTSQSLRANGWRALLIAARAMHQRAKNTIQIATTHRMANQAVDTQSTTSSRFIRSPQPHP